MSVRHTAQPASPRRPGPGRTTLTTVGVLVASAAVGSVTVAAESRPVEADLDATLSRTEGLLGAWDSPQDVLAASHRTTRAAQAAGVQASPALAQTFRFDIAFGPLTDALRQFEQVTGLSVTVAGDVARGLTTNGVSGSLTAEQALVRLLAGSALSWRQASSTQVIVEVRVAGDTVEVSGALPRIESSKYTTPLVETPQTIQLIPRSVIEEQGATTLSEALRNVPGITMQAGEGGGAAGTTGDMFNMRGFSAANSLFVDGVRDDGLLARDVYNLEQVEVFSGPTGSDVGRTNAAGYINMTTKSPGLRSAHAGTLAYGSNDSVRLTADLNQPLRAGTPGTFFGSGAVRINALWQDGGVAGRDHVQRETKSFAPSIAFGLDTSTRVVLSGQVQRQNNLPDYGMPGAASPIGPLTATSVVAPQPVSQSNWYGSLDDYDKAKQDNVTLRLEHDFRPGVTVRNQTRYNTSTREAVVSAITGAWNATTGTINAARQGSFRDNNILSNQTSLTASANTGRLRHDLSAGLEVSSEEYRAPGYTGFGSPRALDLFTPDISTPVVDMNVQPSGAQTNGWTDTIAFYLFDGVDLGSRVRVNGGVRVETYDTRSQTINATTGAVTELEGDGTLVSAKAGLVYRLNNQGNLYVSYGSSLTPPGSTNFQLNAGATNQNNPNVDPQKSTNYEVGTKWSLAGSRLVLNGAVFYTENTNVIFVIDSTAIPPVFNQDDGQKVTGVTFGAQGRPLPFWDLMFSVQYLDSERVSQNAANNGTRLTLTPEFSGSLWTTFRLPHGIRIGGGLQQTGRVFINAANTTVLPGYAIANALVEVPIGQRLGVRLNLNNLTDKVYVRSINNNGQRYNPGTPRSFLLSTFVRF